LNTVDNRLQWLCLNNTINKNSVIIITIFIIICLASLRGQYMHQIVLRDVAG